jgi:hypothetical protein
MGGMDERGARPVLNLAVGDGFVNVYGSLSEAGDWKISKAEVGRNECSPVHGALPR